MNLDFWLAEYPSDYLLILAILTEFLLLVLVHNFISKRDQYALARLKEVTSRFGRITSKGRRPEAVVMQHTAPPKGAPVILAFIGAFIPFFVLISLVPDETQKEFDLLKPLVLIAVLAFEFMFELLFWLPVLDVYGRRYLLTSDGIWQPRFFGDRMARWGEVQGMRFTGNALKVRSERGSFKIRFDMTGFGELARLALKYVPTQRLPKGEFGLEGFASATPGAIWYEPPWAEGAKPLLLGEEEEVSEYEEDEAQ